MTPTWTKVTQMEPGKVYQQGNVKDLMKMMQWQRKGVLYFGDHVFSDLAVRFLLSLFLSLLMACFVCVGAHPAARLEDRCHHPRIGGRDSVLQLQALQAATLYSVGSGEHAQ